MQGKLYCRRARDSAFQASPKKQAPSPIEDEEEELEGKSQAQKEKEEAKWFWLRVGHLVEY